MEPGILSRPFCEFGWVVSRRGSVADIVVGTGGHGPIQPVKPNIQRQPVRTPVRGRSPNGVGDHSLQQYFNGFGHLIVTVTDRVLTIDLIGTKTQTHLWIWLATRSRMRRRHSAIPRTVRNTTLFTGAAPAQLAGNDTRRSDSRHEPIFRRALGVAKEVIE